MIEQISLYHFMLLQKNQMKLWLILIHIFINYLVQVLRFFTVYGPFGRPDMALFKFTKNIINNHSIELFNNGNHLRDFTYVDDIVDGIYSLINKTIKKNYTL